MPYESGESVLRKSPITTTKIAQIVNTTATPFTTPSKPPSMELILPARETVNIFEIFLARKRSTGIQTTNAIMYTKSEIRLTKSGLMRLVEIKLAVVVAALLTDSVLIPIPDIEEKLKSNGNSVDTKFETSSDVEPEKIEVVAEPIFSITDCSKKVSKI